MGDPLPAIGSLLEGFIFMQRKKNTFSKEDGNKKLIKGNSMKIWIDIKNMHEPNFFKPFFSKMKNNEIYVTVRPNVGTINILDKLYVPYTIVGSGIVENRIKKMYGFILRGLELAVSIPKFDISISHLSGHCIYASKIRRKKTITFADNDINLFHNKIIFPFVDYLITPNAIPKETLIAQKAKPQTIFQYNGFKEDIYIADYETDVNFLENIPFKDFVTIRPEALRAAYVSKNAKTIVPQLLSEFVKENVNILYLPRYPEDTAYAKGYDNVYIPPEPLNGLDVCFYSKAVLTGSGTFAREAACMGTPAVSFFPEKLLAVDQKMVNDSWMFHSRDPEEIVKYVMNSKKREVDLSRSKKVQMEVFDILKCILEEIEDRRKGKK
jgi:predicted glycosyltransferase